MGKFCFTESIIFVVFMTIKGALDTYNIYLFISNSMEDFK